MLSKDAFTQWFREELMPRWARCAFNEVQIADWYWRLKGFDAVILTEAIRRHHAVDEPRRPSLKKLHEYARQIQRQTRTHTAAAPATMHLNSSSVPEAHTYIQCVAKDENGNGPVGWFVPILLWPFHRTYTKQMFDTAAENQLTLHRQNCGGIWQVISQTTHSAMLTRQWQITGQLERIRRDAAKLCPAFKEHENKLAKSLKPA